jgi:putative transposase
MPRQARKKSSTGLYHIMLRAINRQAIFFDREDRQRFLETLLRFKRASAFKVFGYCLMNNHIHLLIQEGQEEIATVMKQVGISYVYWYNKKYERVGHLFQDRFKSEAVEDDRYLLVVLRYIHQNPLKAGMVSKLGDYEWSSYNAYLSEQDKLVDPEFMLKLFNKSTVKAVEQYREFMQKENEDRCLDDEEIKKVWLENEVAELIIHLTGLTEPKQLAAFDKKTRNAVLLKARERGVPIRILAEVSGIGRGVVERVANR